MSISPQLEESWKDQLYDEFNKPYFQLLKNFIIEEIRNYLVFPKGPHIFRAFNETPFHDVKVIILGQDPYHNLGQADGLCFSVAKGVHKPPSLQRIFKELKKEYPEGKLPDHGSLVGWAKQGVFLLNTVLTVRANNPNSHADMGWEKVTDAAIRALSGNRENLVFILWGGHAKKKINLINTEKHQILTAAHPSPRATTGFFGCNHFKKANNYLQNHGIEPIEWLDLQ
jgi:uracil-DNA glycosylase